MRPLLLIALLLGIPLAARGETLREWAAAAPKSNIAFALWNGDLPTADDTREGATRLPQGFYGYLDLSQLPVDVFPIRLRLLYDAPFPDDIVAGKLGVLSHVKDSAPAGPGLVVIETIFASPSDARAVPVWNVPLALRQPQEYGDPRESVRAEVQSRTGALLGRLLIGASAPGWTHPRAVLINAPGANQLFAQASYRSVSEASRLVPESITYLNVDTIWIDSATAADPGLSDTFWQQVLLGGTTVAGHPADIALLTKRLGLASNEPALLGRLVAADSPAFFTAAQGPLRVISGVSVQGLRSANPFAFSVIVGQAMHRQLLHFSEFYLGIFVVFQTVVIVIGFLRLRGVDRVWLWLVVPCFALTYTLAGITLAHLVVRARSEGRMSQVELQVEGWQRALLLTHLEQLSLSDRESVLDLPFGSLPYNPRSSDYNPLTPNTTFSFYSNADIVRLTAHARPATRFAADTRSFIDSAPPCELDSNGNLTVARQFTGIWLWDGTNWHNIGPLWHGRPINVKTTPIIHPTTVMNGRFFMDQQEDDDFPWILKPLLNTDTLRALSSSGQGLFLGVEPVADAHLENSEEDRMSTRRVIAYQFHLNGGTP